MRRRHGRISSTNSDETRKPGKSAGGSPTRPPGTPRPRRSTSRRPRRRRTREQAWAIPVGAAAAHRTRVGHLEVPRAHVESVVAFDGWPEDVRLGVWVTTTRSRRAKLSAERIAELDALGMRWT
ncbi:helicase associated domain-containing protein [Embleya sp. NPDC020630]|uniref:helicase associated domain-containing protein n=1 Tax=Embleya sp. NPDC020630 TaxID=3363979 RepID=UPI003790FE42